MRRPVAVAVALSLLAGCGSSGEEPGQVRVQVGPQDVEVSPTQACVGDEGVRYQTRAPVLEVSPEDTITLTVPEATAERGWSVQVFDERLEEQIGAVEVPDGQVRFDGIGTSDVVPPAYYLVVVEDSADDCGGFSGAWPVGFIRAGGDLGTSPSSSSPPA